MTQFDSSALLDDLTFAFLDVETTGLLPRQGDRVCEIAVVRSRGDRVQATFATLVNPERSISPGASSVNGLRNADVRDAPRFAEIIDPVVTILCDAVLVCHNAPFDLGFVESEMVRAGRAFRAPIVIDTLLLAQQCYRFRSNSLSNVARALQIPTPAAHRALGDVLTTRAVLNRFIEDFWKQEKRTLGDLLALQRNESFAVGITTAEPVPPEITEAITAQVAHRPKRH